jgi:predicted GIY-YIG superfamily endonuclease
MAKPLFVYILRCADNSYYVGLTDDLEVRMVQHHSGLGSAHTRRHLPVTLVWHQEFESRVEALEMERRVKGWRREKKEALIEGRMEDLKRLSSRGERPRTIGASPRINRDN